MLCLGMKITDLEINDRVAFKYGNNLQFVDTGDVIQIENNCVHIEVKELEVFEVAESELLDCYHWRA